MVKTCIKNPPSFGVPSAGGRGHLHLSVYLIFSRRDPPSPANPQVQLTPSSAGSQVQDPPKNSNMMSFTYHLTWMKTENSPLPPPPPPHSCTNHAPPHMHCTLAASHPIQIRPHPKFTHQNYIILLLHLKDTRKMYVIKQPSFEINPRHLFNLNVRTLTIFLVIKQRRIFNV